MMGQYAVKMVIAFSDTPIVYLLVNTIRKITRESTGRESISVNQAN